LGILVVVMDSVAAITKESAFDANCPPVSIACTVTLYVPAVDGVPEIVPVLVPRPRPVGSNPLVIDQVYGVVPPVAASVAL
jgi:hypothetical protein